MKYILDQNEYDKLIEVDIYNEKVKGIEFAKELILKIHGSKFEEMRGDCGQCPIGSLDNGSTMDRHLCPNGFRRYHK